MIAKVGERLDSLNDLIPQLKRSEEVGAILIFIGVVRGRSAKGERVLRLEYEHHPTLAVKALRDLLEEVKRKHGLIDAIAEHRVGKVGVGEDALYVLVASRHRLEGLKALEEIVEGIKSRVPIWKREVTEGGSYWVRGGKT